MKFEDDKYKERNIIKYPPEQYNQAAAKMKYFKISENRGEGINYKWECRTLPFDRDLIGNKRDETKDEDVSGQRSLRSGETTTA